MMKSLCLIASFLFFASPAFSDIQERINDCERLGGGRCVYDLLRELAREPGNSSDVCGVAAGINLYFQLRASPVSQVACYFDGRPFVGNATYNPQNGRWSCSAWTRGNPQFSIDVRVDGVAHLTNENDALAHPCPN